MHDRPLLALRALGCWLSLHLACAQSVPSTNAVKPQFKDPSAGEALAKHESDDKSLASEALQEGQLRRLPGTNARKAMCQDNSLLLTRHSFQALAGGKYCDECSAFDDGACSYDWPSSDVMGCGEYDRMRNGIYAAYGHTFAMEKWQKWFSKKPWYKPAKKVDTPTLPLVAQKNIQYLKQAAAQCRKQFPEYDI